MKKCNIFVICLLDSLRFLRNIACTKVGKTLKFPAYIAKNLYGQNSKKYWEMKEKHLSLIWYVTCRQNFYYFWEKLANLTLGFWQTRTLKPQSHRIARSEILRLVTKDRNTTSRHDFHWRSCIAIVLR
jgi:hypothetical protein